MNKFKVVFLFLNIFCLIFAQSLSAYTEKTIEQYEVLRLVGDPEFKHYDLVAIKNLVPNDRVLSGSKRGWSYVDSVSVSGSQSSQIYVLLNLEGEADTYSNISARDVQQIAIYSDAEGSAQEILTLDELQHRFTYEGDFRDFYVLDYKFETDKLEKCFKKIARVSFHFRWGPSLSFHTDLETVFMAEPGSDNFVLFSCHEDYDFLKSFRHQYYNFWRYVSLVRNFQVSLR